MPTIRAVKVTPCDNYTLQVKFTTGETKVVDVKPYFCFKSFQRLKDVDLFNRVTVNKYGEIVWWSGQDIPIWEAYGITEEEYYAKITENMLPGLDAYKNKEKFRLRKDLIKVAQFEDITVYMPSTGEHLIYATYKDYVTCYADQYNLLGGFFPQDQDDLLVSWIDIREKEIKNTAYSIYCEQPFVYIDPI